MEDDVSRLIPKPRSKFLKVRCKNCGNEQIFFSHTTTLIKCNVCNTVLAKPSGGKAILTNCEVIQQLG